MNDQSVAFAQYWRNSLADADLGRGALKEVDQKNMFRLALDTYQRGKVSSIIVTDFFKDEPEGVHTVSIVIRPKVFLSRFEHGKQSSAIPAIMTPIISVGLLARDGKIYPSTKTFVPRDILEPLEQGSFVIGSVRDLDTFMTLDSVSAIHYPQVDDELFGESWRKHLSNCDRLFKHVAYGWEAQESSFELADYALLGKKDQISGVSKRLL
jgi:hypothetical protein